MPKKTNEDKVKFYYPDAFSVIWNNAFGIQYFYISNNGEKISADFLLDILAWSDALRQIKAANRKKYYTAKNKPKKVRCNVRLYPDDKAAVIKRYGGVQKFIDFAIEQVKLANQIKTK